MGEGEAPPEGGGGGGEGRHATLINGSKVELSPRPVFQLGARRPLGQEITERESGFIRGAATAVWAGSEDGLRDV